MGEFNPTIQTAGSSGISVQDVIPRQIHQPTRGIYEFTATTGTMAAALGAASQIMQFRWPGTTTNTVAVVRKVILNAAGLGTAFVVGQALFSLTISRGSTAAGSGGAAVAFTAGGAKLRASMGSSEAAARIATTGALTGATGETLDTNPIANVLIGGIPAAAYHPIAVNVSLLDRLPGEYAPTLVAGESLVVRATVPADGTWNASIRVVWEECFNTWI